MAIEGPDISINAWNADYIESMYRRWLNDPAAVEEEWQRFFQGFDLGARRLETEDGQAAAAESIGGGRIPAGAIDVAHTKQGKVDSLIYHYRDIGHLAANLDPLGSKRPFPEQLTLESFGLNDGDLDELFDPGHLPVDNPAPLREIIQILEDTYCREIGAEYMHIQEREQRRWLQKRMETVRNKPEFDREHRIRIFEGLLRASALERFLDKRFKGKKWFSLAGAETLITILEEIVELGPRNGIDEYTCGMAHRGRVNVLVNILGKTYEELFTEFHESWVDDYVEGGGDVKYHRGYSSTRTTSTGQRIRLTMASNPSHLESVNPVVLGRCRAKQRLLKNEKSRDRVVPILMHGDASFPAQGVVAECLNMMSLSGYTVGGTVHIVVNNQIGFTTEVEDARSGHYCTEIAKMISAPIFHVNGDDPEACAFVARLALDFRQTFKKDAVIDLWCYRKYGHNETDEPSFTQPLMYRKIEEKTPTFDLYARRLIEEGIISKDESESRRKKLREELDTAQSRSKEKPVDPTPDPFATESKWESIGREFSYEPGETNAPREMLDRISHALGSVPDTFHLHRKLEKLQEYRRTAVPDEQPLDWGMGEMLSYGSLLLEGHAVRLTGQDTERGTFSHRHAVLFDVETGERLVPLNHISDNQAKFCVHNSPLSEVSCVGYEYGYSLADPEMLIVWEAQFGDFANGAQVIIDQFIASAQVKWQRHSGLVLLLPHAYEGQGPEHSSGRLERFLQLCADENMQVIYPTTPAQIFHALRRQLKRNFRRPLIVMTPKSLLRHKDAVSAVSDLVNGRFQMIIDDPAVNKPSMIARLILCSGKIYYELAAKREDVKRADTAIVRIEQLYPYPYKEFEDILSRYENADEILWVQEEPLNAGAFRYIEPILREEFDLEVSYIGRDASATPAVGSSRIHAEEQAEILEQAFADFDSAEDHIVAVDEREESGPDDLKQAHSRNGEGQTDTDKRQHTPENTTKEKTKRKERATVSD